MKRPTTVFSKLLIALLLLTVMVLTACGDNTATSIIPATTTSASPTTTSSKTTVAAATTVSATTATTASAATSASSVTTTVTGAATTGNISGEVTVFAASSLTDPFNEIKAQLEKSNPGLKITYNFGGSNILRTQLEQGAKADVFASANQTELDNALKSGLVPDKGTVFAKNRLVVILPKNNPGKVTKLQDLANPNLKFVTAQKDVPVGNYTLQILDKLSKDPAYSSDFSTKVQANFVSQESNVKQIVTKIQLGEADAGIVYLTDISASIANDITTLDIPDQFNVVATYPISAMKELSNKAGAKTFVDFVLGSAGQSILKKYGFAPFN